VEGNEVGHVGEGGDWRYTDVEDHINWWGIQSLRWQGDKAKPTYIFSARVRVEFVDAVLFNTAFVGVTWCEHFGTTHRERSQREKKKKKESNANLFVSLWGYFVVFFVSMVGWTEWPLWGLL
jgi:hypothetical protein